MLKIVRSDSLNSLLDELSAELEFENELFKTPVIAVPGGIGQTVEEGLARRLGIFMGEVSSVKSVVESVLVLPENEIGDEIGVNDESSLFSTDSLLWALYKSVTLILKDFQDALLSEHEINIEGLHEIIDYFKQDIRPKRVIEFCEIIASVFSEYLMYRPVMLEDWESETVKGWQPYLWREILNILGSNHQGKTGLLFFKTLKKGNYKKEDIGRYIHLQSDCCTWMIPKRIYIIGVTSLSPFYLQTVVALSTVVEVSMFLPVLSREYFFEGQNFKNREFSNGMWAIAGKTASVFHSLIADYTGGIDIIEKEIFENEYKNDSLLNLIRADAFNYAEVDSDVPLRKIKRDDSIAVHLCHNQLREVEVLKDQLLNMIDEDGIALEDIIVMAPNMGEYAPYVDAVLGSSAGHYIPHNISDTGDTKLFGTFELVERLLNLSESPLYPEELFDILKIEQVHTSFNLSMDDVDVCYQYVKTAGIKGYLDSKNRAENNLAEFNESTWKFGLDRLLLGIAVSCEDVVINKLTPVDVTEGKSALALGRFSKFCSTIFSFIGQCKKSKSGKNWGLAFTDILIEMTGRKDFEAPGRKNIIKSDTETAAVIEVLQSVTALIDKILPDEKIDYNVFKREFSKKIISRSKRFTGGGGVLFTSFTHLKGESYKLVYLLGMEEGKFPARSHNIKFDLIKLKPQKGGRDNVQDQRYMFFEAVMAAEKRLIISGSSLDLKHNMERPPAGVISDFFNYIDSTICFDNTEDLDTDNKKISDEITLRHPLYSFSEKYFKGDKNYFTYNDSAGDVFEELPERMMSGSQITGDNENEDSQKLFRDKAKNLATQEYSKLNIFDLLTFYKSPVNYFIANITGIKIENIEDSKESGDSDSFNGLDRWKVTEEILKKLPQKNIDDIFNYLKAAGHIYPGARGKIITESSFVFASNIKKCADRWTMDVLKTRVDIELNIPLFENVISIVGTIENVYDDKIVEYSMTTLNASRLLIMWIKHLVLSLSNGRITKSVLIGRDVKNKNAIKSVIFSTPPNPAEILGWILEFFIYGQILPLSYLSEEAFYYAKKQINGADETELEMYMEK
ncbi:MAG: exodeoxyribonuclease V subunit gamma, partial [Deltaproteobacteria bacterium]|nr:exodeoxyribonuclease V subunit gamma [Deltaproteobacteria bacterium]